MVMFSIISVYYQGITSNDVLQRFLDSLNNQSYKDFELILLHDGPLLYDISNVNFYDLDYKLITTSNRENMFGHNLRDIGINVSNGKYILHTNADNLYYDCLGKLIEYIISSNSKVVVLPVIMKGLNREGTKVWYDNPRDYTKSTILTGNPVRFGNIDLMQLIASKDIWLSIGGWYDLHEWSDAHLYELIDRTYKVSHLDILLGEHY